MSTLEKRAWFVLIVVGAASGLFLLLVALLGFHTFELAVFGLLGLLGLENLVGRRGSGGNKVALDERDAQIAGTAAAAGFGLFWVVLVLAAMTPFFVLGPGATLSIKTETLTWLIMGGLCFITLVRAIVTIALYRRAGNA
jgi:hypothetical protein